MQKIVAFCKRNPMLSHEEYRAAHAGYHVSASRRLRKIRGYLNHTWSDRDFNRQVPEATFNEPEGFYELWDGSSEVWWESFDDFFSRNEKDRAGPDGLEFDTDKLHDSAEERLFGEAPHLFAADERVIVPVHRPERYLTKLYQFAKRKHSISQDEFIQRWQSEYAILYRNIPNIFGYTLTSRLENIEVMRGFYPDKLEKKAYSEEGILTRKYFYSLWDGIGSIWLDNLGDFNRFRLMNSEVLSSLEKELFDAIWYREIDESMGVLPKRGRTLPYYYR